MPRRTRVEGEVGRNVLLISDRYLPEVGGSITWFDNVYRRFPRGSVTVVTQDYPDAEGFDASYTGVRVVRTHLARYRYLKPESLLLYVKLIGRSLLAALTRRVDVVHVGKVLPEAVAAWFVKLILRRPYVAYAHGEEITIFMSGRAYRRIVPALYNSAAAVIANSAFTRELLVDIGVERKRIVRISPGVDTNAFFTWAKRSGD